MPAAREPYPPPNMQACTSSGNSWCRGSRSSQPSASGDDLGVRVEHAGQVGQPEERQHRQVDLAVAGVRRWVDHPVAPSRPQMHVAVPEVAVQPGRRLLRHQLGEPPITASIAEASSSVAHPAVAGELEVGQHPPGRVELRPGAGRSCWASAACRCSRRCSRPYAGPRPSASQRAPARTPRRHRGSCLPGSTQRRITHSWSAAAPRARALRRPRRASAAHAPRPRRTLPGRGGGSSSARWCRC